MSDNGSDNDGDADMNKGKRCLILSKASRSSDKNGKRQRIRIQKVAVTSFCCFVVILTLCSDSPLSRKGKENKTTEKNVRRKRENA